MARYLTIDDMIARVGSNRVNEYFDDDLSGDLDASETDFVDEVLTAAENEADSRLLRSFTLDQITELAENDEAFRRHASWIALEFASERRTEFLGADGQGAYGTQYNRAIKYFESLSRGKSRSKGELVAGKSGRHGGRVRPTLDTSTTPRFVFAPDRNAPTGHGGF